MIGDREVNIKIGGDYDPVPTDKYTVQIADVNPVTQFNKFKGEEQELLNYQFVILDMKPMPEAGETTRGRFLWRRMTQNLSSRSWLMKFVVAVYGRNLTQDEMESFHPDSVIGMQVDVMTEQNPSSDGTTIYNNIISFSKTTKKLESIVVPAGQAEIKKESAPAIKAVDTPEVGDGADFVDAFVDGLEEENEEASETDTDADEVAELEAALKEAKAKAKKVVKKA